MSYNPFTVLPITLCDQFDIPAFAACQNGATYGQLKSQVSGLLILPDGVEPPADWELEVDWADVVDNSVTDNSKAKYLVGRGSFLPNGITELVLAGGRLVENRERVYRLSFTVLNMNDGHSNWGRKLQKNVKEFRVWIQTIGNRIIGGPKGIFPVYVNADFLFTEGDDDRENMLVTMDFVFEHFPAMTELPVDFTGTPIDPGGGGECECNIQTLLTDLEIYNSDAEALADGVSIGGFYIAGPGHDRAAWGTITTRLE